VSQIQLTKRIQVSTWFIFLVSFLGTLLVAAILFSSNVANAGCV
jgi:sensor domain CHASE-containing protein